MFRTLHKRRGLLAVAGSLLGASVMLVGTALPAGATPAPAANATLIGGGSNTAYTTMQQLDDLFNTAPGCQLLEESTAPPQETDYSCAATPQSGDENGYTYTAGASSPNPFNDVAFEEPAMGSSVGVNELQGLGSGSAAPTVNAAPLSYARSSRAPNSADQGLEFVGYAEDAVPWFHFTKVGSSATPSAGVTNLTVGELQDIYDGTDTNWDQLPGGTNGPIDCYMAQNGSGTEKTFTGDLSISATPACLNDTGEEATTGGATTHGSIFENEISDILQNGDQSDAIFFFSFGKFTTLCKSGACPGGGHSVTGDKEALGEIGGVTANQETITGVKTKKKKQVPCGCTLFVTDRMLYNVYENGNSFNASSNYDMPVAPQSTLNYISSYGFLCSVTDHNLVDPLSPTQETYGTEIGDIITAQGFFQIPLGNEGDTTVTGAVAPSFTGAYAAADTTPSTSPANNGDQGYCRVQVGS